MYAAQAIPPIDAEIAEKGHFWMETKYGFKCSLPWQRWILSQDFPNGPVDTFGGFFRRRLLGDAPGPDPAPDQLMCFGIREVDDQCSDLVLIYKSRVIDSTPIRVGVSPIAIGVDSPSKCRSDGVDFDLGFDHELIGDEEIRPAAIGFRIALGFQRRFDRVADAAVHKGAVD